MSTFSAEIPKFAKVERRLLLELNRRGAPPAAKEALFGMLSYIWKPGSTWRIRHKKFSESIGMAYGSVRRGLRWLKEAGMVAIRSFHHPDGGQGANEYQILWWPEEAKPPKPKPKPKPSPAPNKLEGLAEFLGEVVEEWGVHATEHARAEHDQRIDTAQLVLDAGKDTDADWVPGRAELAEAMALVNGDVPPPTIDHWAELRKGNPSLAQFISDRTKSHPLWCGLRKNKIREALLHVLDYSVGTT